MASGQQGDAGAVLNTVRHITGFVLAPGGPPSCCCLLCPLLLLSTYCTQSMAWTDSRDPVPAFTGLGVHPGVSEAAVQQLLLSKGSFLPAGNPGGCPGGGGLGSGLTGCCHHSQSSPQGQGPPLTHFLAPPAPGFLRVVRVQGREDTSLVTEQLAWAAA